MGIEATLGLPQVISNLKTKSVKGLSYTMIGMWFMGDFAKTVYFVTEVTIY
jgi:solute carrier family 66, member 2